MPSEKKAQVVLVQSPVDFYDKHNVNADQNSSPPMGLLYVTAALEEQGVSVRLIDPYPEKLSLPDVLRIIAQHNPLLVGISTMTPGARTALVMAKAIRKKFGDDLVIGVGGFHPSVDLTFVERYPVFDFQVAGESEITLCNIFKDIQAGKPLQRVYKGEPAQNLDDLPFPARHLLKGSYFCPHDNQEVEYPEATMISSRGCPSRCIFCSKPAHRNDYRFRSAKDIVDEMESVMDKCNGRFNFVDDTMGADFKRMNEFCDEILKRKMKVSFATSIRAIDAKPELFAKLSKAGCREMFIGVESGSKRIRNKIIKKPAPEEKLRLAVKLCRKYGIQLSFYLMMGFPTETWDDIRETMEIGPRTGVDFVGVHITQVIPGSRIYDIALKEGKISENTLDKYIQGELGTDFFKVFPKYVPNGMTLAELENARKKAYRKFFMNPGWIARRIGSYPRHPERLKRDARLTKLGMHVLKHGHTKSAPS